MAGSQSHECPCKAEVARAILQENTWDTFTESHTVVKSV